MTAAATADSPHPRPSKGKAPIFGGVEIGGTKVVCAAGTGPERLLERACLPTGEPAATLSRIVQFFRGVAAEHARPAALGIASFGPIELHRSSGHYGRIGSTPKPGWSGVDVAGTLGRELGLPVAFDTDVNGALLAESLWGAARGLRSAVYVTVGTGIGGGALCEGAMLHGLMHPELGHVLPRRHPDDEFPGLCPYHGDCLEGLAAGPAIKARWGGDLDTLPATHPAHALEAFYLAQLAATLTLVLSPQRIVLGGGVMRNPGLFPLVRKAMRSRLNGYVARDAVESQIDGYLVPPALGDDAGVLGAIALAQRLDKRS